MVRIKSARARSRVRPLQRMRRRALPQRVRHVVWQYRSGCTLSLKLVNNTIDKAQCGINLSGSGAATTAHVTKIISQGS